MNEFVRVLDCALFVGGQETFAIITLRTFMHFDLAVKLCTVHAITARLKLKRDAVLIFGSFSLKEKTLFLFFIH